MEPGGGAPELIARSILSFRERRGAGCREPVTRTPYRFHLELTRRGYDRAGWIRENGCMETTGYSGGSLGVERRRLS